MTDQTSDSEAAPKISVAASDVWTVYCHIHIESSRRYVGLTKKTWRKRWNRHVFEAKHVKKGYGYFHNAIRKYGPEAFKHEVLEICYDLESANATEQKWIAHFRSNEQEFGFNLSRGGSHIPHPVKNPWDRPEFREKGLAALARANASLTPQQRSQRAKKLWADPSFSAKVAESSKKAWSDPELKARQSESQKVVKARPDVKKRHRETSKAMWESSEYRAQNATLWDDPEFRERCQSGLIRGAALNAAKTHCRHGHQYTSENTVINHKGRRVCLTCKRKSSARSARAQRALKRQDSEICYIQ